MVSRYFYFVWLFVGPVWVYLLNFFCSGIQFYYTPIHDTTLELSVFWPSDTESRIKELSFSESISLSFKTSLTSFTCFCSAVRLSYFQSWNQRWKT